MDKVQSENQFPKIRCAGKYAEDPLYLKYHDEEWGRPLHDEKMLYEMFVIELFQAGLSWRTLLHKRKNFEAAYDGFDLEKVAEYGRKDRGPDAGRGNYPESAKNQGQYYKQQNYPG